MIEANLKKCDELDDSVAYIAKEAVRAAFCKGMTFRILETRRTYEKQCLYLSQGRTRSDIMSNVFPYGFKLSASQMKDMMRIYDEGRNLQGNRITWTLTSDHLTGLAMDILPVNTSYAELAFFFSKWGITQPYMSDLPHFYLGNARSLEPIVNVNPIARLKGLQRRLLSTWFPEQRDMLIRLIDRLSERLGVK